MSADSILDALETRLADGLRRDARVVKQMEATARLVLALKPGEGLPMRHLAVRIARDPSTVTRFVARAAGDGLVEQRQGADDRRERLLFLTAAGKALRDDLLRRRLARASAMKEGVQARTGLGADEIEWFLSAVLSALA